MNNNYYVYILINPISNSPFYVGKGQIKDCKGRRYRRIKDHLNFVDTRNTYKVNTIKKIKKMGKDPIVEIFKDNISEEESFLLEKMLIEKYGRKDIKTGILTNLTEGGEGPSGKKHSEETKRKLSIIRKDWLAKNGNPFEGKTHSDETRKNFSIMRKGNNMGEKNYFFGKKHTDEAKHKIRLSRLGTKLSEETKLKCANVGAKNGSAKKYIFTSPNNIQFIVIGEFKKFIRDNKLALKCIKKHLNKGIIPPPKDINHNRMTKERINSSGWNVVVVSNN
jgi:group I intron endonuclease